ncbi:aldo/keto reductase [Vibrio sp. 10N.286.52.B1]|uniref:aldo/keto reductase n=1 Tax=Vibrio sp. 10N.286.52.B1 TaxID=3229712 RepID=UPI003553487E
MQYKQLKDMKVSALGLGCWAMGGTWNNIDDNDSVRTIHRALDLGVNFFDTAPIYGKGHSEMVLGKALKGVKRHEVVIATKCGLPFAYSSEHGRIKSRNDLSRASILKEVDDSLQRLGVDYIDLYQIHWPDPNTTIQETAEALAQLKQQGKIRHVGVCNYSLEMVKCMVRHVEVATFQGLYNLLEHNPSHYHNIPLKYRTRDEIMPFCDENDMSYLPYSPLMQGLLTGTFDREGNFDANDDRAANPKLNGEGFEPYYQCAQQLKQFSQAMGVNLTHLALQWLAQQSAMGPVIAGAHKVEQIEANSRCFDRLVNHEILKEAEQIVTKWGLS